MIIPAPARAPLPTWAATGSAVLSLDDVMATYSAMEDASTAVKSLAGTEHVTQSVVMGIDYKADRLHTLPKPTAQDLASPQHGTGHEEDGSGESAQGQRQVGQRDGQATEDAAVNDEDARTLFSAINLAEWVVVVEGINGRGKVAWEAVFDASSSDRAPRMQLFRYLGRVILQEPRKSRIQHTTLKRREFTPLTVHRRVGKIAHAEH